MTGAFLHATLPESISIYLKLPLITGVEHDDGRVVKIIMSFYDIKHASKLWYEYLAAVLTKLGFKQCLSCDILFSLRRGQKVVIVLPYVDDLALFRTAELVEDVISQLRRFEGFGRTLILSKSPHHLNSQWNPTNTTLLHREKY